MKIRASSPHFFVSDIITSVRFYVDVLGFDEPKLWGDPPAFAMPSRDGFVVMLNQADSKQPRPNGLNNCWDVYFWCDAVDEFYQFIHTKGVDIVHGPEIRDDYGMKEIGIRDPDGYMLVFAEDIEG
ncbi:MAG: VOC family protein [Cyanobacteria bacterium P01_E01_bin.6]